MKTIFGANWLTTILGWIEKSFYTLAMFVLANPAIIHDLIPKDDEKWWAVGLAFIGFLFGGVQDWNIKDKSVTGGTVPNDTPTNSGVNKISLFLIFAGIALGCGTSLAVSGCKSVLSAARITSTTVAVESDIQKAINGLPATFKADIAAAVTKVESPRNLNTLANGIESLAKAGAKLPAPASLQNGVLPWVEMLPDVGPIAADVFQAYSVAYPLLKPTAATLTAIGEYIRAFQAPKATLVSGALNDWLRHTSILEAVVRREDF